MAFNKQQKEALEELDLWDRVKKLAQQYYLGEDINTIEFKDLTLESAFTWSDTTEGYDYWDDINNNISV